MHKIIHFRTKPKIFLKFLTNKYQRCFAKTEKVKNVFDMITITPNLIQTENNSKEKGEWDRKTFLFFPNSVVKTSLKNFVLKCVK